MKMKMTNSVTMYFKSYGHAAFSPLVKPKLQER